MNYKHHQHKNAANGFHRQKKKLKKSLLAVNKFPLMYANNLSPSLNSEKKDTLTTFWRSKFNYAES